VTEELMPIGELARRTGVATSALRYYEERGLLRPQARISSRRHYAPVAVGVVGVVLLLRDLGFTLDEITAMMAARRESPSAWRDATARKLAELDARIAAMQEARVALHHALTECESEDIVDCPIFQGIVVARLERDEKPASRQADSAGPT
jgi:DNA-binding transcriptional MerR regulator